MQVDTLMFDQGSAIFYDDDFRRVLEDHMTVLRTDRSTKILNIAEIDAYKYEYDLYSLLLKYSVPAYMHWIVMRVNKMTAPTEMTRTITALLYPSTTLINQIRQSHLSVRRIT